MSDRCTHPNIKDEPVQAGHGCACGCRDFQVCPDCEEAVEIEAAEKKMRTMSDELLTLSTQCNDKDDERYAPSDRPSALLRKAAYAVEEAMDAYRLHKAIGEAVNIAARQRGAVGTVASHVIRPRGRRMAEVSA